MSEETTETVVHVTTLKQWKSVLDVWFEQGYKWFHFEKGDYLESVFSGSHHYLHLDDYISQTPDIYGNESFIEYSDFMARQEKVMAKETYYVTQEQLDLIEHFSINNHPLREIYYGGGDNRILLGASNGLEEKEESAILRYLGGDTSIEFKVKETLYRLWATDESAQKAYFLKIENKIWETQVTNISTHAFTAPLEEIKKWKTPAWEIEKVD
jgi:hypothetical protein